MGHTRATRLFVLGLREWCPVPKVSVFGMCSWWSVRSVKYQLRKTNLALCEEFNRTMLVGKKNMVQGEIVKVLQDPSW